MTATRCARNLELERAILDALEDDSGYLVYGDWLSMQGDPRGELVTLQQQRALRPDDQDLIEAERALLQQYARHLFGDAAKHLARFAVTWRLGFTESLRVFDESRATRGALQVAAPLLAHPSCAFLRYLSIGALSDGRDKGWRALVAQPWPPSLRELLIEADLRSAELKLLRERLEQLTGLYLGNAALNDGGPGSTLSLGERNLQRLLAPGRLLPQVLERRWPRLRELALTGRVTALRGDVDQIFPALRTLVLPALGSAAAPLVPEVLLARLERVEWLLGFPSEVDDDALALLEHVASCSRASLAVEGLSAAARLRVQRLLGSRLEPTVADLVPAVAEACPEGEPARSRLLRFAAAPREGGAQLAELLRCPSAGHVLYNTGARLLLSGHLELGKPLAKAALAMPDREFAAEAWSNAGIACELTGELDGAAAISRAGLQRYPKDPNLYSTLIASLRKSGHLDESLAEVERAQRFAWGASGEAEACLDDCMETLRQADRVGDALVLCAERSGARPTPRLRARRALLWLAAGKQAAGRRELAAASRAAHAEPTLHYARAVLYAHDGELDSALEALREARASGYGDWHFVARDPALAQLRELPGFKELSTPAPGTYAAPGTYEHTPDPAWHFFPAAQPP